MSQVSGVRRVTYMPGAATSESLEIIYGSGEARSGLEQRILRAIVQSRSLQSAYFMHRA
jgi:hypothetical protein